MEKIESVTAQATQYMLLPPLILNVQEMLQLVPPASQAEIHQVRQRDRAAQGITPEQEESGRRAAESCQMLAGGKLTLARLDHDRVATVADRLEPALGGPGFENLLIVCPDSIHFFGSGTHVQTLHERFGGWKGGALPDRGYWGTDEPPLSGDNAVQAVLFPDEPR